MLVKSGLSLLSFLKRSILSFWGNTIQLPSPPPPLSFLKNHTKSLICTVNTFLISLHSVIYKCRIGRTWELTAGKAMMCTPPPPPPRRSVCGNVGTETDSVSPMR